MRMVVHFLLAIFLFWPMAGRAADSASIVKTSSHLCGEEQGSFYGSGWAFTRGDRAYVLTSEHVILHGNGRYCHAVWNEHVGKIKARLKAVEYGNGLALLELIDSSVAFDKLEDLAFAEAKADANIQITGFPYTEKEPIIKNPGRVLVAKSARKLIPLVPQMIETIGAHGEFGMSGGPVFDLQDRLVGILSHQYLRLVPGQRSRIIEFSEKSAIENHLLIIPAEGALQWVKTALSANASQSPYFLRDPAAQLKRQEKILSSGLQFDWVRGSAQPTPIGGADGAGTGGADGAGAGGDDANTTQTAEGSYVRISLDTSTNSTSWYLPQRDQWLVKVRKQLLLPWQSVRVPFFLVDDETNIQSVSIDSLADFFQKLASKDLQPVTTIQSSLTNTDDDDSRVADLQNIGKELQGLTQKIKGNGPELSAESAALLKRVETVANLLRSASWTYVKVGQMDDLCQVKNRSAAWQLLFKDHFDLSVDLLEQLNKARSIIAELKVE